MYSIASFSSFECLDLDLWVRVRERVWAPVRERVLVRVEGLDLRVRLRDGGIGACLVLAEENRKKEKGCCCSIVSVGSGCRDRWLRSRVGSVHRFHRHKLAALEHPYKFLVLIVNVVVYVG